MGLFNKKKKTGEVQASPVQVAKKIDIFSAMAQKKALSMAEDAITKAYDAGRIVFKDNDYIEYTDKDKKESMNIDECAAYFWSKLNDEIAGRLSLARASLALLNIEPKDIKDIILRLRGGK
jgi:hypothetical protein